MLVCSISRRSAYRQVLRQWQLATRAGRSCEYASDQEQLSCRCSRAWASSRPDPVLISCNSSAIAAGQQQLQTCTAAFRYIISHVCAQLLSLPMEQQSDLILKRGYASVQILTTSGSAALGPHSSCRSAISGGTVQAALIITKRLGPRHMDCSSMSSYGTNSSSCNIPAVLLLIASVHAR